LDVRLSIQKTFSLDSAQQRGGAICVVKAECGAMVEFEICFGKVTMQMSLADAVELAVNRSLEQPKETFSTIHMRIATNIFFG
jgi:hypothetical protein